MTPYADFRAPRNNTYAMIYVYAGIGFGVYVPALSYSYLLKFSKLKIGPGDPKQYLQLAISGVLL